MKACFLIRHGATDMAGLFCGHTDPPLNETGQAQIERAVSRLHAPPELVYTSDLQRAQQSAAIVATYFSVPVRVRPGLREICFGQWEGLSWQEIERRFPVESQTWIQSFPAGVIPSAERYEAFLERVKLEIALLTKEAKSQTLAVVTHGGFIRTALHELYGISAEEAHRLSAGNGAIVDLSQVNGGTSSV